MLAIQAGETYVNGFRGHLDTEAGGLMIMTFIQAACHTRTTLPFKIDRAESPFSYPPIHHSKKN